MFSSQRRRDGCRLISKTGIPENVIIEKFGLYEKHVADETMHASDLAIAAAKPILLQILSLLM